MTEEVLAFGLILNPPNYEKILFGFPSFREVGLLKYDLYHLQQRVLNPENIPRRKKTSLYQVSSRHLELWIEDTFVRNFDQHAFDGLAFAWSRAQRDDSFIQVAPLSNTPTRGPSYPTSPKRIFSLQFPSVRRVD
ncbi:unnamed protein product [Rhizophagus irregularis]|nr:unnamed protein product [Rhizophagus irregularis]